jgi:hypothetical protein
LGDDFYAKALWDNYAANKIIVTIIKSWKSMIETEIYLINFENLQRCLGK